MSKQTSIIALPKSSNHELTSRERSLGRRTKLTIQGQRSDLGEASFSDLGGDIFYSLMKREPKLKDEAPKGREVNRMLLDWMTENDGFEKSRQSVAGNLPAAMIATQIMHSHLTSEETYKKALKEQEKIDKNLQKMNHEEAMAQAYDQARKVAENAGNKEDAKKNERQMKSAQRRSKSAKKRADQAIENAKQELDKIQNSRIAKASLQAIANQAAEEAGEISLALKSWGNESGSPVLSDPTQAQAFLNTYDWKLRQISNQLGRMNGLLLNEKNKESDTGFNIKGAEYSKELERIFPSELVRLNPINPLRGLAIQEWQQNGMMSWKTGGSGKEKGNFYFALDESGSMYGIEEVLSKGAVLGVCQSAKAEGRKYRGISFSGDRRFREITSENNWQEHMNWAKMFMNGGTNFDYPLNWAMDAMDKDESSAKTGDLLIVTDGICSISDNTIERWEQTKEKFGTRLIYVGVNLGSQSSTLDSIADEVIHISSFETETETFAKKIANLLN